MSYVICFMFYVNLDLLHYVIELVSGDRLIIDRVIICRANRLFFV